MRATFGDYRTKMAEEEKKMRLSEFIFMVHAIYKHVTNRYFFSIEKTQIQFTQSSEGIKSHFVKKSALQTLGTGFRFDFPVDKLQQLDLNNDESKKPRIEDIPDDYDDEKQKKVHAPTAIVPSDNSFKFNFNIQTD